MLCIGIDAALATTGWAALRGTTTEDVEVVGYGVIATGADMELFERVWRIRSGVRTMLREQAKQNHVTLDLSSERFARGAVVVAIERTDYSPGRKDSRERWVREASARESLAIGLTAAMLACDDLEIEPQLVGPSAWQSELGANARAGEMKMQVANLVAYQFPNVFVSEFIPSRKRFRTARAARDNQTLGALPYQRAVLFAATRKPVPSHITDAVGMAYVVLQRECRARRLGHDSYAV